MAYTEAGSCMGGIECVGTGGNDGLRYGVAGRVGSVLGGAGGVIACVRVRNQHLV